MNNYIIGSGYYNANYLTLNFSVHWTRHIDKFTQPKGVYVINHTGEKIPFPFENLAKLCEIKAANLGHVHQLVGAQKPALHQELCGFSASIMLLALAAYNANTDLCYVEQDVLLFGDCIGQAYRDLGNKDFIFGENTKSGPKVKGAQSFFIVRHSFIPTFVRIYLGLWPDTTRDKRPEGKFLAIESMYPQHTARLSFGVDRDRPLTFDASIWYAQHLTNLDMKALEQRGLLV